MLQQLRLFNAHYDDYGFQPITGSWSRCERIIAGVETGTHGFDARFIVTSPTRGTGKALGVYCARG